MVDFSRETLKVIQENQHLVEQHWEEVVIDKSRGQRPAPDWEYFETLEKNNSLVTFIARENGIVIGYSLFILHKYLHNKEMVIASNDAVFLQKDKRPSGAGARFLRYCDDELAKLGIGIILWHVKPEVDFSGTLKRLGYALNELTYMKVIGG